MIERILFKTSCFCNIYSHRRSNSQCPIRYCLISNICTIHIEHNRNIIRKISVADILNHSKYCNVTRVHNIRVIAAVKINHCHINISPNNIQHSCHRITNIPCIISTIHIPLVSFSNQRRIYLNAQTTGTILNISAPIRIPLNKNLATHIIIILIRHIKIQSRVVSIIKISIIHSI